MKLLLSAEEVRAIDAYNQELGQGTLVLMNAFARAIADEARRLTADNAFRRILVVAGCGNNGGDGLVSARMLSKDGYDVDVLLPIGVKSDAAAVAERLAVLDGIRIEQDAEKIDFNGYTLIIDALFGIGLDRAITGELAEMIEKINASSALKLAVDVPSGIDDFGRVCGVAVQADATVTACGYKRALIYGLGQNFCGRVTVADIGALYPKNNYAEYVDEVRLPARERVTHKGNYANVYCFGNASCIGAGLMAYQSCRTALTVGAGLAHMVVPQCDRDFFTARVQEEILLTLPSADGYFASDKAKLTQVVPRGAVAVIGMGGGSSQELCEMVETLSALDITLIVDADGLRAVTPKLLREAKAQIILTPHIKEFARLTGLTVEQILSEPESAAREYAAQHRVTLLLKSNYVIATDGQRVRVTAEGSPAQAKGGSGDVLAGAVAGLVGLMPTVDAAITAAVICANAAVNVAKKQGEHSVLASDVLEELQKGLENN